MNDVSMVAGQVQMSSAVRGEAQPSEQQVARFAEQLNAAPEQPINTIRYGAPLAANANNMGLNAFVEFASRTSESMRASMQPFDHQAMVNALPDVAPLMEVYNHVHQSDMATMQFRMISELGQGISRNVHTLYQQQG